jgi:predicted PurR-regulated permease PerM
VCKIELSLLLRCGAPMLDSWKNWSAPLRWGLAFPLFILNAWLLLKVNAFLEPLSSIVVGACLLAFVLDIPLQFLDRRGLRPWVSITVGLAAAAAGLVGLLFWVAPRLFSQIERFVVYLPRLLPLLQTRLGDLETWAEQQNFPFALDLDGLTQRALAYGAIAIRQLSSRLVEVLPDLLGSTFNFLLTLILTLFLLVSGRQIANGLISFLPSVAQGLVRGPLREKFQAYWGGQILSALLFAGLLWLVLSLIGLDFALLYSAALGLGVLIPFLNPILNVVFSLITALQNPSQAAEQWLICFLIGQVNDNFLQPRIVGELIGLQPFWILVSILLGAKLLGVLGLFLAVPLASFIQEVARRWQEGHFSEPVLGSSELE